MSDDANRIKWNERYGASMSDPLPEPAQVLIKNLHLLPETGHALDLACGLGANAILLASRGLQTTAWDSASTAIERLDGFVKANELPVDAQVRDVVLKPPEADKFDIIVVSRFLHRPLSSALVSALRSDGLLFYQTFVRGNKHGPKNPDFLLKPNELLTLFSSQFSELQVRFFEDNGQCGNLASGLRDESLIVLQKV